MKNSEDHIDKLFKEKLGNQSFDIPTEFIDDLNNRLDEVESTNQRKGGIWFFLLNGLFLFIFISLFFMGFSNQNQLQANATQSNVYEDKNNTSKNTLSKSNEIYKIPKTNEQEEYTKEEIDFSGGKGAQSMILAEVNHVTKNSYEAAEYNTARNGSKRNVFDTDKKTVKENDGNNDGNKEVIFSNPKEVDFTTGNSTKEMLPPDTVLIRDTIFVYDTLSVKDTVIVTDTIRVKDTSNVELDNAKVKFDLQLFAGFSYGGQTFSQTNVSGSDYVLEENPLFTPSFGFNINASWKNINIGTGVEYFQIGEDYALSSNSVIENDTVEVVGYDYDTIVFNEQTQTFDTVYVPVYDSVTYYDTITTTNNWLNSYSWLSIPLNLGYRFKVGKWAVIPRAGVTFNFGMRNSKGQYPNSMGSDVLTVDPVVFNLDYLLQLEIRRSIGKAEIYVSPNYRGNATPVTSGSSVRKYKSVGLRFGVAILL